MKAFADGIELDAGLVSLRFLTDFQTGWAELDAPGVLTYGGRFALPGLHAPYSADGPAEPPEALMRRALLGGGGPLALFCRDLEAATQGLLVVQKMRGRAQVVAVVTDELEAVAGLAGSPLISTPEAAANPANLGRAARVVVTRERTWLWPAKPARAGAGQASLAAIHAEARRRNQEAWAAPLAVDLPAFDGPVLTGVVRASAAEPPPGFAGAALLTGWELTAPLAAELAALAGAAAAKGQAFLAVCSGVTDEGLSALRHLLHAAPAPVLVATSAGEALMEGLAMATGGRFLARDFLLPVRLAGAEELGTFRKARLDGDRLRLEGRANEAWCRGWLRAANRDYLTSEREDFRRECVAACLAAVCALEPALRVRVLKAALAGKW
jgi:hypothetical protein